MGMEFIGKAVVEYRIKANNQEQAMRRFKHEVKWGIDGVKKEVVVEPVFTTMEEDGS